MSWKNVKFTLLHRFAILFLMIIIGFSVFGYCSFKVLNEIKVNGPIYTDIVRGKDLIADILPPPENIIESYLTSLQLIDASPAERKTLIETLTNLKKEYEERHDYWKNTELDDYLKEPLINNVDKTAREFYQLVFDSFIPALEKGDKVNLAQALVAIKSQYYVHRTEINKLVELANKHNTREEGNAKTTIESANSVMLMI